MKKIIDAVKKQIIPSKKEQSEREKVSDRIIGLIRAQAVKNKDVIGIEIGGSYAKGTWVSQQADIDIFVKFKEDTPDKRFREQSQKIGFAALDKYKPYVRYSEHPYVEALVEGVNVNIVPCYNVKKGNWKSSADRSQYHTKFMLKELDRKKQDEVRVLKQFLKANNIYGAQISKQGFSGYVSEVLIWNFKSFKKVLEEFSDIQQGDVIGDASKTFDTTIAIVDPIDGNRNLAAAISDENLAAFILASRIFLKKPSIAFFKTRKMITSKEAQKQIVTIEFSYNVRSPDVIWGQIKKASASLSNQLNSHGFNVIRNAAVVDKTNHAALVFLLESHDISKKQVKEGPEIFQQNDVLNFIAKNRKKSDLMWIDKSKKIISLEKREFDNAVEFLQNQLTVKLERSGIPKGLRKDVKEFVITHGGKKLRKSIKEELLEFVSIDQKIFSPHK